MPRLPSNTAAVLVVVAVLLPVLYVGTYLGSVDPPANKSSRVRPGIMPAGALFNHYRFGGEFAARFFWPLEYVDRIIRPSMWEFDPNTVPDQYRVHSLT